MSSISQRTGSKSAIQRTIAAALLANRGALEERLKALLFPDGAPPEVDLGLVLESIVRVLGRDARAFEAVDQRVADETSQDRALREARDEAVGELRESLIGAHSFLEGVFGLNAAREMGLRGQTPENPDQLMAFARNVVRRMRGGLDRFQTRISIAPPDIGPLVDDIQARLEKREGIIEDLVVDLKETEDAQNERNQALNAWNRHYVPVASIMENLFRLAEMPRHAERVRPTNRRRAGLPEVEDLEEIKDGEVDLNLDLQETDNPNEPAFTGLVGFVVIRTT